MAKQQGPVPQKTMKTPFVHLVKFSLVGCKCKFCSDLLLNTLHYTPKWREKSTPLPTLFGLCNKSYMNCFSSAEQR